MSIQFFILYIMGISSILMAVIGRMTELPEIEILTAVSNVTSDDTIETQHTICRISSDQLNADAEATVIKVLTGACNAKVINDRFEQLDKKLDELKGLILRIDQDNFLPISPRQSEIEKLNGTVSEIPTSSGPQKVFIYYWKVEGIKEKLLEWKTGRSERSNTFYVEQARYAFYIKITPKYFPDGTIFIAVGLTRGVFDEQLAWPFSLRLQIEILDHSPGFVRDDRASRLWDPSMVCLTYFWSRPVVSGEPDNTECVGLSIHRYILHPGSKYLWNDNLITKLTVYL